MKRIVIWMMLVACIALGFTTIQAEAAADKGVHVVIDGKTLKLENSPPAFVEKGRTLLPVRGVFEQLGLEVKWDQKANTATITGDGLTITMKPGVKQVTVNGAATTVDVPVTMKNNRIFIPVRFVMENAGLDIEWNQQQKTVYLKSGPEGELVEDTEAFLEDLIAANEKLASFTTKMAIDQKMSMDGESMDMNMNLKMDIIQNPFSFYQYLAMKAEELGDEELSMESYFTKDGYYTYDSTVNQWVKYDDEMFGDLQELSDLQIDPQAQFELLSKFAENLKVYDQGDTYEMRFNVSGEGFQELLDFMLAIPELGFEEDELEDLGMDFEIHNMSIATTLDKKTLFPIKDKLNSNITVAMEGEEINITQKASITYSNHNAVKEIVIPQEVIKQAISLEEYLEQFGFDMEEDAA